MPWTYSQATGELKQNGQHVDTGYSGSGAGLNNPRNGSLPQLAARSRVEPTRSVAPFHHPHAGALHHAPHPHEPRHRPRPRRLHDPRRTAARIPAPPPTAASSKAFPPRERVWEQQRPHHRGDTMKLLVPAATLLLAGAAAHSQPPACAHWPTSMATVHLKKRRRPRPRDPRPGRHHGHPARSPTPGPQSLQGNLRHHIPRQGRANPRSPSPRTKRQTKNARCRPSTSG